MAHEEYLKEFDDIRPYNDKEFFKVTRRLSNNKYLKSFISNLRWPNCPKFLMPLAELSVRLYFRREIRKVDNIQDFQRELIIGRLLQWVVDKTTSGLTSSGLEELDMSKSYLFVSNHRDIVLDASFINYFISHEGYDTTQIAFGDNLLINEFVSDLIRINRSFIVKRNLPPREQIKASITLSKYINYTLENGESIWIAQKEGRSKDGSDQTNPAVIKMFFLSQRKRGVDFSDFINKCRIIPVSLSYELDPCDTLKGWEMYRKETRDVGEKTQTMDLVSMWAGMKGAKGRVHVHFGQPLQGKFENDKDVALALDREIHRGYKLWPSNYISYDELHKSGKYADRYSEEERQEFLSRFKHLGEPVIHKVLSMYARPVLNQEEAVFSAG
ncbi:MAG: 1-acyl-sn-glycerol-3-phosphate acyltransferase [Spirochaetales bacterium]|uniref:1-acyl-sn-glycerol-3-phosphate acyltransferase n=1 Tax=Candidatus Thalassospirochaeta sargassi TaxID=3119039 RepID=A0AAJ1ID11_9SPIO|nr:1-acyl-sn-glycerol-3-phosphate acyltransferase [Spirochaetales bacterium]